MEKGIVKIINSVYQVVRINLLFVVFSLMGLVVFGVGPAWLSVKELDRYYFSKDEKIRFTEMVTLFKNNFIKGNALFYTWLALVAILSYNIYLGLQIQNIGMLMVSIILIVLDLFVIIYGFYIFEIASYYDIGYFNTIKLAFFSLFSNVPTVVLMMLSVIVVAYASRLYPGLYVFITMGTLVVIPRKLLTGTMNKIDEIFTDE